MCTPDPLVGYEVSSYRVLVIFYYWWFTLGRFDVHFLVYTMVRYNDEPSKVHIGAILGVFVQLNHHIKCQIICDTSFLDDQGEFGPELNWF